MRIAIVEDNDAERARLCGQVRQYAAARGQAAEPLLFCDGEALLRYGTQTLDVVLLDIQMQPVDGMTAAQRIRQSDRRVVLIFVTSMVSYAVQGYRVDALDFLVKPVSYPLLQSALDRAAARIGQAAPYYINLRAGRELHHIDVRQLLYAEACEHKLLLQTTDQAVSCPGSIRALEKELEPQGFFCCHAAFLVNLDRIDRLDGSDLLLGGHRVPVSKHRRKLLVERLAARWGAEL